MLHPVPLLRHLALPSLLLVFLTSCGKVPSPRELKAKQEEKIEMTKKLAEITKKAEALKKELSEKSKLAKEGGFSGAVEQIAGEMEAIKELHAELQNRLTATKQLIEKQKSYN